MLPQVNTVIVIKTNDLYLKQKRGHNFRIDPIAQACSPELKRALRPYAESLTKDDIQQFVKEYSASPASSTLIDFQNAVN